MNKKQKLEAHVEEGRKRWAEKRPNWLKEPIARIESPLKFIADKATVQEQNAKGQWVRRMEPFFYDALDLARTGNGAALNAMALKKYYE
jgi:hypothetical protein